MTKKTPNHAQSAMKCPVSLAEVDLFGPGAQEHWYEAYEILQREAPVKIVPGEGLGPGSDGFILTRYADISRVVKDPERFEPTILLAVEEVRERVEQAYRDGVEPLRGGPGSVGGLGRKRGLALHAGSLPVAERGSPRSNLATTLP